MGNHDDKHALDHYTEGRLGVVHVYLCNRLSNYPWKSEKLMPAKLRSALDAFDARAKKNPVLMFFIPIVTFFLMNVVHGIVRPLFPVFINDLISFLFFCPATLVAFWLTVRASKILSNNLSNKR
jgi:hypothetical protein